MKKNIKYLFFAALASAAFSACGEKEVVYGTENLNKEKPSIEIILDDADRFSFEFTLEQSDNSRQFAYAVCEKTPEHTAPSAYDVVIGNVDTQVKKVFNESDYRDYYFSTEIFASAGNTYVIYAASITSEGVLSQLASYEVVMPEKIPFRQGVYKTQGTCMYREGDPASVVSQKSGEPFTSSFEIVETETEDLAIYQANWFNIITPDENGKEYMLGPALIGVVNYDRNVIEFDGRFVYNGGYSPVVAFGVAFYYYNEEDEELLVFWGGGEDGTRQLEIPFDNEGNLLGLSDCMYMIHDNQGSAISVFDALRDGTLTYDRPFPGEESGSMAYGQPLSGMENKIHELKWMR